MTAPVTRVDKVPEEVLWCCPIVNLNLYEI